MGVTLAPLSGIPEGRYALPIAVQALLVSLPLFSMRI